MSLAMSPVSLSRSDAARLRGEAHEAVHGEDMRLWRAEIQAMKGVRSFWEGSNERQLPRPFFAARRRMVEQERGESRK